jgi:pimeloyl-ACP methyl ester carboxylesterase
MAVSISSEPWLPYGRRLELDRRGTTFVREVPGPPGAPTLLLLHGWIASGGMNWYQAFVPLGEHFRVLAPDLRGHARGLRTRGVFRLADCADDCAEMLLALDAGPVIVVGYSMGGAVAQLLWRRHRDLVDGLVLCATAADFVPSALARQLSRAMLFGVAGAARLAAFTRVVPNVAILNMQARTLPSWVAAEMRRHDWRLVAEAGHSLSTYHAQRWISEIDVPTAVLCTTEDRAVPPALQLNTADAIPGATVHRIADGHLACAQADFGSALLDACGTVADRVNGRSRSSRAARSPLPERRA